MQYNWSTVDVSNDGQTMVAASAFGWKLDNSGFEPGKIFASENGGDTWADITPEESDDWQGVVVSGDGSTIAAIEWGEGVVHLTEDAGDNWTNTAINVDIDNTKSISISDNGDKILVGGENNNDDYTYLYFSGNSGDTWTDITPNPDGDTHDIQTDISADGTKIVATSMGWAEGGNDSVFISNNDGLGWDEITPGDETPAYWTDIAMSDNASALSVLDDQNNKMYVSNDLGASWTEEDPGQEYEDSNTWVSLDMNQDGSKPVVAGEENAYLSSGFVASEQETEPSVTFDEAEGGKTVTLTTPAGTTITCHSAVKESSLTGKDVAYSYPLGLVDFCFSGADISNGVTLTFVTDLMPSQVVARKYNPTSGAYSTITTATITETTLEGKHALRVSYSIEDNGPLDTDPDNGEVADPVGLGRADIAVPNTGFEKTKK
jgi:photosystem II stability/assembly factor-like uncharacterized protein